MLKVENTEVFGWEAAIRGMRNPLNSWNKRDSHFGCGDTYTYPMCGEPCQTNCQWMLGENDLKLMKQLSKAGPDHGKFLRFINVTVDITAPLYWWKEFDTYKVGTVANSCSTMHKIHAKEFTVDDFSHEHLDSIDEHPIELRFDSKNPPKPFNSSSMGCLEITVGILNYYRGKYLECAERLKHNNFDSWNDGMACKAEQKRNWWQMIQLLPTSYNQKRTVQLNYQVLKSMYYARKDHKLDEWHTLCDWMLTLPYFKEVAFAEE